MTNSLVNDNKPIISIKEARKIMGKDADNLSDEEVERLIEDLDFLARNALKQFKEFNQSV